MDVTVIIPIHEYNEKIEQQLKAAITSVEKQENLDNLPSILIVFVNKIESEIIKFKESLTETKLNINFIKNEGKTDFQSQVNLGVEQVGTEYFSVLEFDDEYSSTYFKNVKEYIEAYPEIDLFLPIIIEVNDKRQRLKLTNETVWARQFVGENGEVGYLNTRALNEYTDFKTCGAIFKKEEFIGAGKYKSNIKLTFQYEFLLRMLNNGSKIFTIPKIGYMHLAIREGSLFDSYAKTMSMKERKFWFDTAKKEYNFFTDRPIDMSLLQLATAESEKK